MSAHAYYTGQRIARARKSDDDEEEGAGDGAAYVSYYADNLNQAIEWLNALAQDIASYENKPAYEAERESRTEAAMRWVATIGEDDRLRAADLQAIAEAVGAYARGRGRLVSIEAMESRVVGVSLQVSKMFIVSGTRFW